MTGVQTCALPILDFMWGFEGVTHEKDGGGVQFNGEMADLEATYLVGKVKAKGRCRKSSCFQAGRSSFQPELTGKISIKI